jgi:cellulose synthase (UDP-forming)
MTTLTAAQDTLVASEAPSGPRFRGRRCPTRPLTAGTLSHLLPLPSRLLIATLTMGWLVTLVWFWAWWFRPEHSAGFWATTVNSTLLGYLALQPTVFLLTVNRLRQVAPDRPVPSLEVALVVTKAPSEPWPVARATLQAMLGQDYPFEYDVWICDEDPTDEVVQWCVANGVGLSNRKDRPDYHSSHWPRRTRCKEGNLAWFYDNWGYDWYDVVVQLDCDHVPAPGYLSEMVRPFADPAVGYVAAPSVCDANATNSWSARGRLYREAAFHGPVQTGHNGGFAPVCIGSHYAVRTSALRQVGGIGPELAEDFSTAFLLSSAGWQGVFAHQAEARGDGPLSFAAMVTQEFQWCRSMIALLLELAPRHLHRMPWRLRLRFLHTLSFYPAQALLLPLGLVLTAVAAATGFVWIHVHYVDFLVHWGVLSSWLIAVAAVLRAHNLLRPRSARLISWESSLYVLTRWVWISAGAIAAVRQVLTGRRAVFAVTPKARDGLEPFAFGLIRPYLLVSLVMASAALLGRYHDAVRPGGGATGYVVLCLLAAMSYSTAGIALPVLHAVEAARAASIPVLRALRRTALIPLLAALATAVPVSGAVLDCRELLVLILL